MTIPTDIGIELFKSFAPMIVAVGAFAIGLELLKQKIEKKVREKNGEPPEERIKRLTNNLKEAISTISEIEKELKERQALAEKVKSDYEIYQKLADLKKEEVDAVTQALRGELREEGNKSLWISIFINLAFFMVGIFATKYIT
ncbi:MAG: hypothetical protein KJ914_05825 [Gammaproteobacteria bacterium]|nr:hypothetical protein [Gammaproteobacteria bacterium]